MKKAIFRSTLLALSLLLCILMMMGCVNEETDEGCIHGYTEWTTVGEECQDMVSTRTCTRCGEVEEKRGSEDDHVWEKDFTFPSTCNRQGWESYKCLICNKGKSEELPLSEEHSLGEYQYDADRHYKVCSVCHGELEEAAHSYLEEKCQVCGVYESYCEITLWVQNGYMAAYKFRERIAAFEEANKVTVKLTLKEIDSATAASNILSGDSSADVFCFSQDYLQPLVDAGALMPLGYEAATRVTLSSSAAAVASATEGGVLYGYPLYIGGRTSLLYYDKSLISAEDATSLERLIEICEENGKSFRFQMSSGWGVEHFFLSTGCHSDWGLNKGWEYVSLDDNYNSEAGVIAANGIMKLIQSTAFNDETYIYNNDGSTAVLITEATWQSTAEWLFGENLGIATLPSFTVDGESYQIGSLSSTVMLGIKPTEDNERAELLSSLALWLTNAESQAEYFDAYRWCPTSLSVQTSAAVMAEAGYAERIEQYERSAPEKFKNLYWGTIAGGIYTDLSTATTDEDILAALKRYDDRVRLLFEKGEYS